MHNDRQLALDALEGAKVTRRPRPGLVHHSDRGSVYASGDYRQALSDNAMIDVSPIQFEPRWAAKAQRHAA